MKIKELKEIIDLYPDDYEITLVDSEVYKSFLEGRTSRKGLYLEYHQRNLTSHEIKVLSGKYFSFSERNPEKENVRI